MFTHKIYSILIVPVLMLSGALPQAPADAASYEYDTLSRITRADYDSGFTEEYTYDRAGNRLTVNVVSQWISGYGHTSPDNGTTAEMDVEVRASSPETALFTYNNTSAGIDISGISISGLLIDNNSALITGECTLNGLAGYHCHVSLTDGPDTLELEIYTPDGNLFFSTGAEVLTDGDTVIGEEPAGLYQLTTSSSPYGGGSLTPDCQGGCMYENGTTVTITAERNTGYAFSEWSGCDSYSNNICTVTMGSDRSAEAFFTTCSEPVLLAGAEFFSAVQDAYDNAVNGDTIEIRETLLSGEVHLDRDISVTLDGGHDCTYVSKSGVTVLDGPVTISSGTVTIGDIIVE